MQRRRGAIQPEATDEPGARAHFLAKSPAVPTTPAFEVDLPHGRCVGFSIARDAELTEIERTLPAAERAVAGSLAGARRRTWVYGRIALRRAMQAIGVSVEAIGATPRGAPALPPGVTGSISHKDEIVVALAAISGGEQVGVDVERDRPSRHDLRRLVLRPDEGVDLDAPWLAVASETLLRFSAKEAIYKALDRYVGRYVGFGEVAVVPRADQTAAARLHLRDGEGPFDVDVRWERRDGFFVTSARVAPAR